MNITSTQSQTLIAALQPARASVRLGSPPVPGPPDDRSLATDTVEVGAKVNAGFATRVLQDSLQERFDAALKKAGLDTSTEDLLAGGLDTSPEATAKRIVDFSVGFLAAYTANHPKDEAGPRLDNFISLIKKAVDEGFGDARDLLSRVGEVPDEVNAGIDQTYDLVMTGIDGFAAKQRQVLELAVSGEMPASVI